MVVRVLTPRLLVPINLIYSKEIVHFHGTRLQLVNGGNSKQNAKLTDCNPRSFLTGTRSVNATEICDISEQTHDEDQREAVHAES
jgi:hypothetical protein